MIQLRPSPTRRQFLAGAAAAASLGCSRRTADGFRPLFDGTTLKGWRTISRVPVAAYPGAPEPSPDSPGYKRALTSKGRWVVENGVVIGGQDPPGSTLGSYLITEETFGDFELIAEVNPDWAVDSGIMIRATPIGGQGFQVHLDYRMLGSVATFFGNGIGNWRARHYAFNPKLDASRNAIGLVRELAPDDEIRKLAWHSAPEEFFRVWKFGDWNTMRVLCGRVPAHHHLGERREDRRARRGHAASPELRPRGGGQAPGPPGPHRIGSTRQRPGSVDGPGPLAPRPRLPLAQPADQDRGVRVRAKRFGAWPPDGAPVFPAANPRR